MYTVAQPGAPRLGYAVSVAQVATLRVMTPGTAQDTAFQENRCADTRAIVNRKFFDVKTMTVFTTCNLVN
jgi:hypothetical protein